LPKVSSFKQAGRDLPGWWLLQVEGEEQGILVHNNRIHEIGPLEPGEEIVYELTKFPVYSNSPYRFVVRLERVPKAALEA
jgi:hypothetical protein